MIKRTLKTYSTPSIALGILVLFGFSSLPVRALEWEPALETESKTIKPNSTTVVSQDYSIQPLPALQSLDWTIVTPDAIESTAQSPQHLTSSQPLDWEIVGYEVVDSVEISISPVIALQWQMLTEKDIVEAEEAHRLELEQRKAEAAKQEAIEYQLAVQQPLTGGLYQISRGERGLPAITQRIPTGYGAQFLSFKAGLFLESCNVTGNYVCGSQDLHDEFKSNGKGKVTFLTGLGDPIDFLGLDLGFQVTSLATSRFGSSAGTPAGSGRGIDLAVSRNITPDIGVKVGAFNLVELDEVQLGEGRSAFGVITGRFDLGGHPAENTNDLYLTLGMANGIYRPLSAIIDDQEQECAKDIDRYGYRKSFKYGDDCEVRGFDYGELYPIASAAYMINEELSLIAEWWGRNLTLAASYKPFAELNWVITPGITNVIGNSDWDSDYPGYTERMRIQLTTSISF